MAKGMPWIRAYTSIRTDPRSLILGRLLGDAHAYARILDLRLWLADNAPDGIVRGPHAEVVVEEAVGWRGEPGAFARAARDSGFIRATPARDSEGISLVDADWADEQAAHLAKIERDRSKPDGRRKSRAAPVRDSSGESRELRVESREEEKIPPTPQGGSMDLAHPVFEDASPTSVSGAWTLPDAVDAVHREVMEGRPYRWDLVHDEKAATILLSLCAAEGIPAVQVPEEAGRRFGRALVRSLWRFERAAGKAVTLRELARRECWAINAEAPRTEREVRNEMSGVSERREVAVEPWDAILAKREAA